MLCYGRLYDMSGESLSDDAIVQIWKMLYQMGKEGKLDVFEGVSQIMEVEIGIGKYLCCQRFNPKTYNQGLPHNMDN